MTYTAEKVTAQQSSEQQLITIEFAPKLDPNETKYNYQQPLFVFGEQVILRNNQSTSFKVCGMELVESKTSSGQLLNQPYWKYKVDNGQENIWLNESALVRYPTSCSQCTYFNNFDDPQGRGWCNLFGTTARQHHLRTNDCDLFSDSEPLNTPHPSFAIESIVKIIDSQEHHSEWATFTVVARRYNTELYRNTEAYFNEPDWFYQLAPLPYENTFERGGRCFVSSVPHAVESFWVAENDICDSAHSHLICTDVVF
jgi:hypothetical protein